MIPVAEGPGPHQEDGTGQDSGADAGEGPPAAPWRSRKHGSMHTWSLWDPPWRFLSRGGKGKVLGGRRAAARMQGHSGVSKGDF